MLKTKDMIEIDAQNKTIGRVASEAAYHLLGKHLPTYTPNQLPNVEVKIINASLSSVSDKKKKDKKYARFSGYPGGLRFDPLEKILKTKGYEEVYKRAIKRMMPSNRLRAQILKNLTIID